MKIKLDKDAIMPTRAHEHDAGLDLYAPKMTSIPGSRFAPAMYGQGYGKVHIGRGTIDTGVHVQIPEGMVGYIKARSSLLANFGLLTDGTIDSGYTGSIRVTMFNTTCKDYVINAGDKIAQLVIQPCALPGLVQVDELEETERGASGFGSTGK